jgi:sugar phosphate isomerase/epimerase
MTAFRYMTSTVLYAHEDLDGACRAIATVGLEAVDVWHVPNWCEHLADGTERVRDTLARHGLRLEAISAYGRDLAEVPALLEVLAALGGHALVLGSAGPEVSVAAFAERVAPLAARARDLGVRLAIENHGHATIDSLASMEELAARLPDPALGFALAPIHLWVRGEDTAEAVRRLAGRIALMYLWDWGPSAVANWKDPSEQFLGTGRIDYRPIVQALRDTGYARPLCLFAHGAEDWPPERTTEALRQALARARALEAA